MASSSFTRRNLLLSSAALSCAGTGWLWACARSPRANAPIVATPGRVLGPGSRTEAARTNYHLSLLELADPRAAARLIELNFMAHGVILDPGNPARALLFEKRGPGACEVDLARAEVLRTFEPTAGSEFYGHGAFLPEGSSFLATETEIENGYRGKIVVRDAQSFAIQGEFPSFGESPHDCTLRDNGQTLWVTNGGSRSAGGTAPSVVAIDVSSQRLLERLEFANPALSAGHLALSRRGDLAAVCAMREWMDRDAGGAVSFRPLGGDFQTMSEPAPLTARMLGESLSVAIHEATLTVAVTNPRAHLVTFWNLERAQFLARLDLAFPRGVIVHPNQGDFLISHGANGKLLPVDVSTLCTRPEEDRADALMNGSHLFLA